MKHIPSNIVVGPLDCALAWPSGWEARSKAHWDRIRARIGVGPPQPLELPKVPVVFVLHKRMGQREDIKEIAESVAERGALAVYWDAPNHGARQVSEQANTHWLQGNLHSAVDMYSQMMATMQEISLLLDFLAPKISVQFEQAAVLGFSQGGHAALLAFTHEPRLNVCISVLSAGDYTLNMAKRFEYFNHVAAKRKSPRLPSFQQLFPDAFAKTIQRLDPISNTTQLARGYRPLLMLNGEADKLVPYECNASLFRELKALYPAEAEAEGRLSHKLYHGVKHDITDEMLSESFAFLEKWLLAPSAKL